MRVTSEPAFVLHHYDWSESSCIVELLTQNHGRVAVVAKGAKKPTSNLRAVLLPMQPITVSYSGDADIQTLKSAQYVGGYAMPNGQALLSGLYVNELILRLLPRDEPHAATFMLYTQVIALLATQSAESQAAVLRAFELSLLRQMGWLADLRLVTHTQALIAPDTRYILKAELGLVPALQALQDEALEPASLVGQDWCGLEEGLQSDFAVLLVQVQTVCAEAKQSQHLRAMLRQVLQYHHGAAFRVPQLINQLRASL